MFVNARLHVSGGALGGGRMVEDSSSVAGILLITEYGLHLLVFFMVCLSFRFTCTCGCWVVLSLFSVSIVSFSSDDC